MKDKHFKEVPPEETVAKLKGILNDMGVEVEESWIDESSIGTHSLRVTFKGTNIGTNGKGVSKIYAEASAYAELFERYQNLIINSLPETNNRKKCGFYVAPDEKIMPVDDLLNQGDSFFKNYFRINGTINKSFKEKRKSFLDVNTSDEFAYKLKEKYVSLPFYSLKDKKVYYLPKSTVRTMYGSNGMSAGNTPAEAIVQAISEIFERVSQRRILFERPNLPDVPESYIKKYPYIFELYEKLKRIPGYRISMKDCSFGGKYPVAGLTIIQENTGRYGIKLGCHPDFGVAMERTFTEATQGGNIDEYASRSIIDYSNSNVTSLYNISNSFTVGFSQYPYETLYSNDSVFVPVDDVSDMSNKEILDKWVKDILNDGYDILIRDVSTLGFPSYHVIIPGLTEMDQGDAVIRARNTRAYVTRLLVKPSKIKKTELKYILGIIGYFDKYLTQNSVSGLFPFATYKLPFSDCNCGLKYLAAMCYVATKKYDKALKIICNIESTYTTLNAEKTELNKITSEKYYLQAILHMGNHDIVMKHLNIIFSKEICERLNELYAIPEDIIKKQYPDSDFENISSQSPAYIMTEVMNKMREYQKASCIEQLNISKIFN